jgi:hypothetical protein
VFFYCTLVYLEAKEQNDFLGASMDWSHRADQEVRKDDSGLAFVEQAGRGRASGCSSTRARSKEHPPPVTTKFTIFPTPKGNDSVNHATVC